jgi:uncharacterized protein YecE (DUF72 family)
LGEVISQTPEDFLWGLKIPEQISVPVWPVHPRYGALAGLANPTFLDTGLLEQAFLRPLEPYRSQIGVLLLEFATFASKVFATAADFVGVLDPFLSSLPSGWRYGVEIRTPGFLGPRYFDCLRAHNVAHVYNAWTRMPGIHEQLSIVAKGAGWSASSATAASALFVALSSDFVEGTFIHPFPRINCMKASIFFVI